MHARELPKQTLQLPASFAEVVKQHCQWWHFPASKDERHISVTTALSKLMEHFLIAKALKPPLMEAMDSRQFGVIPNSSTVDALVTFTYSCILAMETPKTSVCAVFYDLRKAFDLVDHGKLLQKLKDIPYICLNSVSWIQNFLTGRKQRIKLATKEEPELSDYWDVVAGVPQGTKSGPWLFALMINDLKKDSVNIWKFVDDTTTTNIQSSNQLDVTSETVSLVNEYFNQNRMELNFTKLAKMIFQNHNGEKPSDLSINGVNIPEVQEYKMLGVIVRNDFSWKSHVKKMLEKCSKTFFPIIMLKRAGIPIDQLLLYYTATIRSVLEYAAPVWHHELFETHKKQLENMQKKILRIITGDYIQKYKKTLLGREY